MKQLRWYQSLRFKALASLAVITVWLMLGIFLIMAFKGKTFVEQESLRHVEQAGNTTVAEINAYANRIEALTVSLGTLVEQLPKSMESFMQMIPPMIDFHGDLSIAGGGVWPEPYTFDPALERRSFFWGRNENGVLQYFDSYNQSEIGYHHEEWYVPSRYTQPGKCFWSRSYMDPYSMQPMVTCTVGTYAKNQFSGSVTLDIKLEGLHALVKELQALAGGYTFIVDRNNKFITFPEPEAVCTTEKGSKEFINTHDFMQRQPAFAGLAEGLSAFNHAILERTKKSALDVNIAETIAQNSYQIEPAEATLIAAMLNTDEDFTEHASHLHGVREYADDYLLKQPVVAFYFHVPDTFWKLVIVKPKQEIEQVARTVTYWLMIYLGFTTLLILLIAFFLLQNFLILPLWQTTKAVAMAEDLVAEQAFERLHENPAIYNKNDEIGVLARVFNKLSKQVEQQHQALESANNALEDKVKKRTAQLEVANQEIKKLNDRLTAENLRMGTELEVAQQLQKMVLPKPEEFEVIQDLDIAGFMKPADEVGGDYYDVLHHEDRVKIGIGDITGHGLESGVLMLMVQTAVRTLLANNVTDPQTFLCILNRVIYENIKRMGSDKNLTLSLLDYRRGGNLILTGQHEEVLIVRQNGQVERVDTVDLGFMVGLEEDIAHLVRYLEVNLQPGDGVVLYTDGLTEAMNTQREQYSVERLCEVVQAHWQRSAVEIQDTIVNSVRRHIGSGKPLDDITLLVVKQKPIDSMPLVA